MPKGQYEHKHRGGAREAILDAATRIYAHYGFEGATLQRMADEAGVTRPLIIKYFGDKQGLVRAITDRAVCQSMERLAEIDETPHLNLRQRAERQLENLLPAREDWCLILGTMLVPSFEFAMRGTLENYLDAEYRLNIQHIREFKNPVADVVYAYTFADISMRIGFVVGGREENFRAAQKAQQDQYLLPEQDILRAGGYGTSPE